MDKTRLKPVCLIIIDGFGIDYLSNENDNFLYFKKLAESFPFFMLRSSDINVDYPWNSYVEIGTGTCIKDEVNRTAFSEIIKDAGLNQLYVGESELYPNITYFFSNKNRFNDSKITKILISQIKSDSYLYDSDMIAGLITSKFLKEIEKKIYDFAVIGYPNLINNKNIETTSLTLSSKIKSIVDTVLALNGVLIISSNSSLSKDNNFVPLFLISKDYKDKSSIDHNHFKSLNQQSVTGNTYDIVPTVLKIMGISKPQEMRGVSLI